MSETLEERRNNFKEFMKWIRDEIVLLFFTFSLYVLSFVAMNAVVGVGVGVGNWQLPIWNDTL